MNGKRNTTNTLPADDALSAAKKAGLLYVSDSDPGYRRQRCGRGFRYLDRRGRTLRSKPALNRIAGLVIPPAWTEVWICPVAHGHLQVTGRDARGRKQYRYHPDWCAVRDQTKYDRMREFAVALPAMRRRVEHDFRRRVLCREKVLALIVRLLEETLIRVGNEEYARFNGSYGLSTLRDKHASIQGSRVTFEFRGKSGINHSIEVDDPRVARAIRRCQEIPGQELFQYIDQGRKRDVTSGDVNQYLREISGQNFTAKDFRTWAGTVLAAKLLFESPPCDSARQRNRIVVATVDTVARQLGNTRAVCRKCYIHPRVLTAYMEGKLSTSHPCERSRRGLSRDETRVLAMLNGLGRQPPRREVASATGACP